MDENLDAVEVKARTIVAGQLTQRFESTGRMIECCERLAGARRGDRVAALNAAARILRADAHLALGLARIARIETRRRTISERYQMLSPAQIELNSKKIECTYEDALEELQRRIERLASYRRDEAGQEDEKDGDEAE